MAKGELIDILNNLSHNEKTLLYKIYWAHEIYRKELFEQSGLKIANFYNTVDKLLDKHLIEIKDGATGAKGRPSHILTVNGDFCYYISIIQTKSHYYFSILDFKSQVLLEEKHKFSKEVTLSDFVDELNSFLKKVEALFGVRAKIILCGFVSGFKYVGNKFKNKGESLHFSFLEVDFLNYLQNLLDCHVITDSISRAAAFGLFMEKFKESASSLVFINLSQGIGLGIIHNNELIELGEDNRPSMEHWALNPMGKVCSCGSRGCLVTSLGTSNIVNNLKQQMALGIPSSLNDAENITIEDVIHQANFGDTLSIQAFQEASKVLAIAIRNFQLIFNCQVVAVGGSLCKDNELFFELLKNDLSGCGVKSQLYHEENYIQRVFKGISSQILNRLLF